MTGYKIGSNGVAFSPQAGMRASVFHLSNYIGIIANRGVTKEGLKILNESSI